MDFINLNTAISLTGLSRRTLWRRIADGALRTREFSATPPHANNAPTQVLLDDVLALSRLRLEPDERALILAADQGDAAAQGELGLLLLAQGMAEGAVEWLERAALLGDLEGMHWLGRCLIAGTGVAADERRGMDWISRAANHGHVTARRMVQYLYDPARPAQDAAQLEAVLDGIERQALAEVVAEVVAELDVGR